MSARAMTEALGLVAGQAIALFLVSRGLLLGVLIQAVAVHAPRRFGRAVLLFLRLPGNLLHELSHAAGYLISGYSISGMSTCLTDPEGRGYCRPGRPWSPIHWMPLAAAIASILPLLTGALAIGSLADALGVPLPKADIVSEGVGLVVGRLLSDLAGCLSRVDWLSWQTYLFWYLALSIGAELAPSDVDLRRGGPMLLVMCALFVVFVYAVPHMELRAQTAQAIYYGLSWALSALSTALFVGLVGCGLLGAAAWMLAVMLGVRVHRRG